MKVLKLHHNAKLPTRREGDVGYDLYTTEKHVVGIDPVLLGTGVAIEFYGSHVWGMIVPRSSTMKKFGIRVEIGTIDNGYRGELLLRPLMMLSSAGHGERIEKQDW